MEERTRRLGTTTTTDKQQSAGRESVETVGKTVDHVVDGGGIDQNARFYTVDTQAVSTRKTFL